MENLKEEALVNCRTQLKKENVLTELFDDLSGQHQEIRIMLLRRLSSIGKSSSAPKKWKKLERNFGVVPGWEFIFFRLARHPRM